MKNSKSDQIEETVRELVGSCNCLTKTPDASFHSSDCRYRLAMERLEKLENEREAMETSSHPAENAVQLGAEAIRNLALPQGIEWCGNKGSEILARAVLHAAAETFGRSNVVEVIARHRVVWSSDSGLTLEFTIGGDEAAKIVSTLNDKGYRVLAPEETDPVTAEKCGLFEF